MVKRATLNLMKIPKQTLRQRIYDELKSRIISGRILPGQVMTLNGLAKELGVSYMPVREALWQLESQKIIVIESNKSIHVNSLTKKEMEEALQLRLMLETRAAEKACETITGKQLPKIERLLTKMDECIADRDQYMFLNRKFHSVIYSYIDSPMLLDLISSIWARISPYIQILGTRFGDPNTSVECHRGIYDALTKKDKVMITEWLRRDLSEATKFILDHFDDALSPNKQP